MLHTAIFGKSVVWTMPQKPELTLGYTLGKFELPQPCPDH